MAAFSSSISLFIKKCNTWLPLERFLSFLLQAMPQAWVKWLNRKVVPGIEYYPLNSWRMLRRKGLMFKLDLSQHLDHSVYWSSEDSLKNWIADQVDPGMVCFDIGSNIGVVTLMMGRKTGTTGSVFAVEPDANTFKKMHHNVQLNGMNWVTPLNIGMGSSQQRVQLYQFQEGNDGANRILTEEEAVGHAKRGEIVIETLDSHVSAFGLSRLDVVKIDVEGYEHEVIRGGMETIRRFKPLLIIELIDKNLRQNNSSSAALIADLEKMGYACHNFQTQNAVTSGDEFADTVMDVICFAQPSV
jgi:FkbM family methyltransferase